MRTIIAAAALAVMLAGEAVGTPVDCGKETSCQYSGSL